MVCTEKHGPERRVENAPKETPGCVSIGVKSVLLVPRLSLPAGMCQAQACYCVKGQETRTCGPSTAIHLRGGEAAAWV